MAKRVVVDLQKLKDIDSGKRYWDFVNLSKGATDEDAPKEDVRANPDSLAENALDIFKRGAQSTKASQLLDRAVDSLLAHQRDIYIACYRDQESQEDVAQHYGISQPAVAQALKRALNNIAKYCHEHEAELDA